jgi:hypothetical protein
MSKMTNKRDDLQDKSRKMRKSKTVIYHADTSSIIPQTSTYCISYYWQKPLEEPSKKDVFPCVKVNK